MAEKTGYFLMHRGWLDNRMLCRGPFDRRSAWAWLIEHASHQPYTKYIGMHAIPLQRGQLAVSERYLCEAWGWGKGKLSRFLHDLKTDSMLGREPGRNYTVLTICNYCAYQEPKRNTGAVTGGQTGARAGRERGEHNELNKLNTLDTSSMGDPPQAAGPPRKLSVVPFNGLNDDEIEPRATVPLADDFALGESWGEFALKLGRTREQIGIEATKFVAYFTVGKKAGTRRTVKGWRQSWNNWIGREK